LAEKAAQKKTVREVLQTENGIESGGGEGASGADDGGKEAREGMGPGRVAAVEDGTLDALISEMKTTAFRANARGPARRMSMKGNRPPDYTKARPWLK
jgi:hypothetical protein